MQQQSAGTRARQERRLFAAGGVFLVCGIGIAGFFQRNGAEGFLHAADVVQIAIISHDSAAAVKDYTRAVVQIQGEPAIRLALYPGSDEFRELRLGDIRQTGGVEPGRGPFPYFGSTGAVETEAFIKRLSERPGVSVGTGSGVDIGAGVSAGVTVGAGLAATTGAASDAGSEFAAAEPHPASNNRQPAQRIAVLRMKITYLTSVSQQTLGPFEPGVCFFFRSACGRRVVDDTRSSTTRARRKA